MTQVLNQWTYSSWNNSRGTGATNFIYSRLGGLGGNFIDMASDTGKTTYKALMTMTVVSIVGKVGFIIHNPTYNFDVNGTFQTTSNAYLVGFQFV